jgi:hypothetical protein
MNEYEFLGRLIMKGFEFIGYGLIAILAMLAIQFIVFKTTGFSIYNYLLKNLS